MINDREMPQLEVYVHVYLVHVYLTQVRHYPKSMTCLSDSVDRVDPVIMNGHIMVSVVIHVSCCVKPDSPTD